MNIELKRDIIYNKIKNDITSGVLKPGEKLPRGQLYAQKLGVSYITLRRAFADLARDGYIVQVHGKGTFIGEKKTVSRKRRFLVLHRQEQDLTWPYHYIITGIEHTAKELGIGVEICLIKSIEELQTSELTLLIGKHQIAGIIVITSFFLGNEKILTTLNKQRVPVILTHACREDYQVTGWATTTYNVRAAWKDALLHLRNMGHRHIMTLGEKNSRKVLRGYSYDEYVELLEEIGADPSPELIHLSTYNDNTVPAAIKKAFMLPVPPTAIICHSDFYAADAYKALKNMGIRIPDDVAVMGFCGAPDSKYMVPPLSTIDLGYFAIGKKVVETLNRAEEWFDPDKLSPVVPPLLYTDYKLQVRESTNIKVFEYDSARTG